MSASTGRPDYDHTVTLSTLQPGEPIFVLRGRDAASAATVRAWANYAYRLGTPDEAVELALQQADRLEGWPDKKVPDGPDLTEDQRKGLRAQMSRRAWNARERLQGDGEVLAHRLGQDAVLGQLRPILTSLEAAIERGDDLAMILAGIFAVAGRSDTPIRGRQLRVVQPITEPA